MKEPVPDSDTQRYRLAGGIMLHAVGSGDRPTAETNISGRSGQSDFSQADAGIESCPDSISIGCSESPGRPSNLHIGSEAEPFQLRSGLETQAGNSYRKQNCFHPAVIYIRLKDKLL